MRRLAPLLLLQLLAVACAEAGPADDPACTDCGPPRCPPAEAPADCPPGRIVDSIDLDTGCPTLVCGACPQVEPPACEDAEPAIDPETGCVAGWNCPACPEPEVPTCRTGKPVLETDPETGCSAWSCPPCPEPEEPNCSEGWPVLEINPSTLCEEWICPDCPDVGGPPCADAIPSVDDRTGCTIGWSCPGDRWAEVEHLSGAALEAALRERIDDHVVWTYADIRDEMFGWVDVHDGQVECVYTGRKAPATGDRKVAGFNTEHSWPRSDGADVWPRETDLHHLFPTDMSANSHRGNLRFGETDCDGNCPWAVGGSEKGPSTLDGATIFEVRPIFRGDVARAHFYFSVRYDLPIPHEEEVVLRQWHAEDPPSGRERGRNDRIESLQENRNPFVDRPDFVDRIADF